MTARGRWRLLRFGLLVLGGCGVAAATMPLAPHPAPTAWASLGTAYASLALLAASLLVGPWHVLRQGRPMPPSSMLRRDIGICAGGFGLAHVAFGLQVHLGGDMLAYFARRLPAGGLAPRFDLFGLTNDLGLLAALVMVLLLGLSNTAALRRLGAPRWKQWQRANYLLALLVLAHGVVYQVLEKRSAAGILLLLALAVVPAAAQALGWRRVRSGAE
jgi:DMSO/TMAO reductase YedYZ heme-binding membrane subunit